MNFAVFASVFLRRAKSSYEEGVGEQSNVYALDLQCICFMLPKVFAIFSSLKACIRWKICSLRLYYVMTSQEMRQVCFMRVHTANRNSLVMSARPSVGIQLRDSHWTNFREISYLRLFTKTCRQIAILYKNNRHLYNDLRVLLIGV
jgi:hypothetical protein